MQHEVMVGILEGAFVGCVAVGYGWVAWILISNLVSAWHKRK